MPGTYQLQITAPGFNVFEEKEVEIEARETTTLNAQLTVAFEEQQVTIDDETSAPTPITTPALSSYAARNWKLCQTIRRRSHPHYKLSPDHPILKTARR